MSHGQHEDVIPMCVSDFHPPKTTEHDEETTMSQVRENRVIQAMKQGRKALGYNITYPSVWDIEILGRLDFDFVWIDGEHGPFGYSELEETVRAVEAAGATAVARVENVNQSTILQYLDRGIQGILGPHIASGEDAEALVDACYFGPRGKRSFGGNRGTNYTFTPDPWGDKTAYYKDSNDNMLVGALLEDQGAVDNIDDILKVEGIHHFGIGPNDFAQGIGYPGQPEHPDVVKVMNELSDYIHSKGRLMSGDIMTSVWIHDLLLSSGDDFMKKNGKK
jgi:2-keto-3-deoxy-L-rhamnonate aldolase RhmA